MSQTVYISHGQIRYVKTPTIYALVQKSLYCLYLQFICSHVSLLPFQSGFCLTISLNGLITSYFQIQGYFSVLILHNFPGVDDGLVKTLSSLAFCDATPSRFSSHLIPCSISISFLSPYCSDNRLNASRALKPSSFLYLHSSEYLIYSYSFKYHV